MRRIPEDKFGGASAQFYRFQIGIAHLYQSAACSQTIIVKQSVKSV